MAHSSAPAALSRRCRAAGRLQRGLYWRATPQNRRPSVKHVFRDRSLALQFPLAAAALCLAVGLTLVALAATSSRHLLDTQQQLYGDALARQLARRVSAALEGGDLLSASAYLHRFVADSPATGAAIFDLEGTALGRAGGDAVEATTRYDASVRVGPDVAGRVVIAMAADASGTLQQRFLLGLGALAVLLSLLVFLVARYGVRGPAQRLRAVAAQLALHEAAPPAVGNELKQLEARVDELPLELLRPRDAARASDEHYRHNAVLYVHLASLAGYVDTLNERNLHRYTDRLHRITYAAAACYGGTLQVARPFGLALCFAEGAGHGGATLRAAACARLIRAATAAVEAQLSLSLAMGMALGVSELGPGDGADIYPALYLQGILDDLRDACLHDRKNVLVSAEAAADPWLAGRAALRPLLPGFQSLESLDDGDEALIERQTALLLARLGTPRGDGARRAGATGQARESRSTR